LGYLQKILFIDPNMLDLMKKITRTLNEILYETPLSFHQEIIDKQTEQIQSIWLDYLDVVNQQTKNLSIDEHQRRLQQSGADFVLKRTFFTSAYHCLLESNVAAYAKNKYSDDNEQKNVFRKKIDSKFCSIMSAALEELKPWREINLERINSLTNSSWNTSAQPPIKHINNRILIVILSYSRDLLRQNSSDLETGNFFADFESVINVYEKNLENDSNINYESRIKEIKQTINYFLDAFFDDGKLKNVLKIQLSKMKEFIELKVDITKLIKTYLNFNNEFKRLAASLNEKFSDEISSNLHTKSSQLVDSCSKVFTLILESDSQGNMESKFHALDVYVNFLTALSSLDFNLYIQSDLVKNLRQHVEATPKEDISKVVNIKSVKNLLDSGKTTHYLLDVLLHLFNLSSQANILKSNPSSVLNLQARAELIYSMSMSLRYFKDQLKYASLDAFKVDCIGPYDNALNEKSTSLDDFKDKLIKVEFYFRFNRKCKEVSAEQALQMFFNKNQLSHDCKMLLKSSMESYYESFNKYFSKIISNQMSIHELIDKAKKKAENWKKITVKECNYDLREKTVPKILAILSIIHSLSFSGFIEALSSSKSKYELKKNINNDSTAYFLKPQSVQILSIMRILSLDNKDTSIPNHLFEILTGQGKSWVLALMAGFFSLIGYKVTVACYSDYLSSRDKLNFFKYMDAFDFKSSVDFCTFSSICNSKISPSNQVSLKYNFNIILSIFEVGKVDRLKLTG
jgi:hypothetical protein